MSVARTDNIFLYQKVLNTAKDILWRQHAGDMVTRTFKTFSYQKEPKAAKEHLKKIRPRRYLRVRLYRV